ncbi:hypothetical protein EJP82_26760 [Paenibacillus anaericanus]|uniref:Uncharacterized protein n=1 Tax=Paenibacillus anaericanus TaxID=170367 RepID=A0A433XVY1_9BACL|nr:hypothetical protein [Paenibacillus anaericanus]RUT38717.1 hypothetical protein EJP82_26760 [Paenibacillus anaericanus]
MLINYSYVSKVEAYNFRSLLGSQLFEPKDFDHHEDIKLAIDWTMGKRLNRKNVLTRNYRLSIVRITIQNPKLFFDENEVVNIERRMYAASFLISEFYINKQPASLLAIKEMLSTPYNGKVLNLLNQHKKTFG